MRFVDVALHTTPGDEIPSASYRENRLINERVLYIQNQSNLLIYID
jgi:hypothetical protein